MNTTGNCDAKARNYTGHCLNIFGSLHTVYKTLTSWNDFCDSCENVVQLLTGIKNSLKLSANRNKTPKIKPTAYENIKNLCNNLAKYNKDYCSLSSEVEDALGGGVKAIDQNKLDKLVSKLQESMSKQLENMLIGEVLKAAAQTAAMLGALYDTCRVIREAKQFRESSNLQLTIQRIEEHLKQAGEFWKLANDAINQIENTPHVRPKPYILGMIHLNLSKAKFENDCARKELELILKDIKYHLEKLSSNRTGHAVGAGLSILNVSVTAATYATTPTFMLSNLTKSLFVATGGFQTANIIGHSLGFYWSHEEIHKLEEQQGKMNQLDAKIKDGYQKIDYGMQKLENIKQRNTGTTDFTLIIEEEND